MTSHMDTSLDDVEVRRSPIEGLGLFALRAFRAGVPIRKINVVCEVTPEAGVREDLGERVDHCDYPDGKVVLLGFPDRHVNHSCDPNAYLSYQLDGCYLVARRAIAAGDEITCDCYALEWGDSAWAPLLPRTIKLDGARDTLLPARYNYLLLKPVNQGDTVGWTHLMNAWWMPGQRDSLLITLNGVDSGWRADLNRFGDSLSGIATYSAVNDQQAPMTVRGRRFACP